MSQKYCLAAELSRISISHIIARSAIQRLAVALPPADAARDGPSLPHTPAASVPAGRPAPPPSRRRVAAWPRTSPASASPASRASPTRSRSTCGVVQSGRFMGYTENSQNRTNQGVPRCACNPDLNHPHKAHHSRRRRLNASPTAAPSAVLSKMHHLSPVWGAVSRSLWAMASRYPAS